ncbi:MAG: hemoglobin [Phenylobacterium sp.]|jgi:hemoglobin
MVGRSLFNSKKLLPLVLMALISVGCQTPPPNQLYLSLGENAGIARLVEDFINELLIDEHIGFHFEEAELDRFHDKLVEQICQLAGGPCEYTGKTMQKIHTDLDITEAQFNTLVEALMKAMDNNKISVGAQNQLLALLVPLRADIIHR